jgi:glycosyltransferase involved in cell wall biosynthesis
VVEAARLLAGQSDVQILIIGDGSQRGVIADQASTVDGVMLLPPLTDTEYSLTLAAADVLLVNERPSVAHVSLPSKLTSYPAAGRPVLAAVAAEGATAAELASGGAGIVVEPGNPYALADAVLELRDDPTRRRHMAEAAGLYARRALGAHRSMQHLAAIVDAVLPPTTRALRSFTPDGYDKGRGSSGR